ncbi:hypothetical protein QNH32_16845 [Priestia flexa]|uniref:hypothetical protein n=1 Tax=Priestia flexa TaxID=86664 RepID=UPI0024C0D962|nr:hypothetical protein [Priestia flexa]WHX78564.1 hypothetical protein QNH32_16845 [Priestia flexa]
MMMGLSNKQWIIGASTFVVMASLLVILYFQFLSPLKTNVQTLEEELEAEQRILKSLNESRANKPKALLKSSVELQKQVPVQPFTEQFMLELQKAEVVSDSVIDEMNFADGEGISSPAGEQSAEDEAQPAEGAVTPAGLQQTKVTVTVESKRYDDLLTFLQTMESSKRITQVEAITFDGPQDAKTISDVEDPVLRYELMLSTFYYPSLENLRDKIPAIDIPEAGNKADPFQTLGNR